MHQFSNSLLTFVVSEQPERAGRARKIMPTANGLPSRVVTEEYHHRLQGDFCQMFSKVIDYGTSDNHLIGILGF